MVPYLTHPIIESDAFHVHLSVYVCRALIEAHLNATHVLGESLVLLADLEGQLAGVAHDDDRHLAVDRLQLLQRGKDEDGSLAHARLGLTEDVHAENGLRDALVLDFRRMFEAAVDDGPEDFRLEEEVSEAGAVDGDVGALHLLLGSSVGGSRVDGNLGLKKNSN